MLYKYATIKILKKYFIFRVIKIMLTHDYPKNNKNAINLNRCVIFPNSPYLQ